MIPLPPLTPPCIGIPHNDYPVSLVRPRMFPKTRLSRSYREEGSQKHKGSNERSHLSLWDTGGQQNGHLCFRSGKCCLTVEELTGAPVELWVCKTTLRHSEKGLA